MLPAHYIPWFIPFIIPLFIPVIYPVMTVVAIFLFTHIAKKRSLKKESSLLFKKSRSVSKIEDKFTYFFKYSNYSPSQVDYNGVTDLNHILYEILHFPWEKELGNPSIRSLPTIGIIDKFTGYKLTVSGVMIEKKVVYFNIYYVWPNRVRILENQDIENVTSIVRLFFERDFSKMGQIFGKQDE